MLTFMDEFIDQLLHEERMYDVILPRIQKRHVLEEANEVTSDTCCRISVFLAVKNSVINEVIAFFRISYLI